MNIFQQEFSTGEVVEAAGITNATLQTWMRRNLIVGHREKAPILGGGTPGAHRKFTYNNVMEIAIAKALLNAGLGSVDNAFQAASSFAHVGDGISGWVGEKMPLTRRDPGMVANPEWKRAKTILAVAGNQSKVVYWDGKNDVYIDARHNLGSPDGFVLLEIDAIYESVVKALGHDPWEVKRLCYPPSAPEQPEA